MVGGGRPKPQGIAEWAVAELRARIADGEFAPGARLVEDEVCELLGVSRNTLREAFRLLAHERLLVQHHNRGVFVRELTAEDVADLYRVRRLVELSAVQGLQGRPDGLERMAEAMAEAEVAEARQDWRALGTANLHFHQGLAALTGSARVDELMARIIAELRLAFQAMDDPFAFHRRYLERNRLILRLLEAGEGGAAATAIAEYLDEAEDELLKAHRRKPAEGG
ncbi:GntR family transcriptional regulator [Kitasatospora sp. MMS16-BH015]|uniref:GntR family transcriptional regulator n=1 Tax=Kitasatospora sp. MMS16-BH015 TaxID=2018025 RepID=UPI00131A5D91|nr:GntR family transcriptional regulator [Kitasatospora sp. MMS16-BH015]